MVKLFLTHLDKVFQISQDFTTSWAEENCIFFSSIVRGLAQLRLDPDYCKPQRSNTISGIQTQTNIEPVVTK